MLCWFTEHSATIRTSGLKFSGFREIAIIVTTVSLRSEGSIGSIIGGEMATLSRGSSVVSQVFSNPEILT